MNSIVVGSVYDIYNWRDRLFEVGGLLVAGIPFRRGVIRAILDILHFSLCNFLDDLPIITHILRMYFVLVHILKMHGIHYSEHIWPGNHSRDLV